MVNRPPAKIVRGMPMLGPFAENWENVEKFQARPDDILIATYPKSGTTWISEIVDRILSGEDTDRSQRGAIYERVPFLEFAVPNMPTASIAYRVTFYVKVTWVLFGQDPKAAIREVARYIGKDLSEDLLENITQQTSFDAMKKNEKTNYTTVPSSMLDHSVSPFMRKGICGDWKNQFTVAQNERFDEHYKREMSNTDLSKRFLF
ncbi:hypothetical protein GDO86_018231 [Hymenochirus boettgeri]|uniref:Sulfotransferase n=1 Tax=Hymenochirus boettgeri TaxID=247094 RepID=A0A8T2IGN3_9PIPI|nr:hypothetical protein GDO86_018231 [Hymenochirus boettgeri]